MKRIFLPVSVIDPELTRFEQKMRKYDLQVSGALNLFSVMRWRVAEVDKTNTNEIQSLLLNLGLIRATVKSL